MRVDQFLFSENRNEFLTIEELSAFKWQVYMPACAISQAGTWIFHVNALDCSILYSNDKNQTEQHLNFQIHFLKRRLKLHVAKNNEKDKLLSSKKKGILKHIKLLILHFFQV